MFMGHLATTHNIFGNRKKQFRDLGTLYIKLHVEVYIIGRILLSACQK